MLFVQKTAAQRQQMVTEAFSGYDHNLQIADGAFYDMENLASDFYPMAAPRGVRGLAAQQPAGALYGMTVRDGVLWYVCSDTLGAAIYRAGEKVTLPPGVTLEAGKKQLVGMGAYLCVFPDGVYYNTQKDQDAGYMARKNTCTPTSASKLTISLCTSDGDGINATVSDSEPENPANGSYWVDTSQTPHALKRWGSSTSQWVQVATTYVKLELAGIGTGLSEMDGILISGITGSEQAQELNGSHIAYKATDNYVVIPGIIDQTAEQTSGQVIAHRRLPKLDYVTECGNRLWGCFYGVGADGDTLNEIYCCKLGDFKNWEFYAGTAMDSWRASIGTDGRWTGAATYNDNPMFFKEDFIHRVYPSSKGAHQSVQLTCEGVQKGSEASLCVVDNVLYYKARLGVYRYDGSAPVRISDALGTERFRNAKAATARGKLYVAMQSDTWKLFCYDTRSGLWHRENLDVTPAMLASGRDTAYLADSLGTVTSLVKADAETAREEKVAWWAQTGIMTYGLVGKKYISRLNLRMQLPKGSKCDFWIQYDSGGRWEHCGHMEGQGLRTFLLPIRPRRCDHLQFKISGTGDFRLLSLARVLEAGSDA